jgi:hypothetical protein
MCSSYYDERTYCGKDLISRADEAVRAEHAFANEMFLSWGYSQDEINHWPQHVLDGARNMVGNGGRSKDDLERLLKTNRVK